MITLPRKRAAALVKLALMNTGICLFSPFISMYQLCAFVDFTVACLYIHGTFIMLTQPLPRPQQTTFCFQVIALLLLLFKFLLKYSTYLLCLAYFVQYVLQFIYFPEDDRISFFCWPVIFSCPTYSAGFLLSSHLLESSVLGLQSPFLQIFCLFSMLYAFVPCICYKLLIGAEELIKFRLSLFGWVLPRYLVKGYWFL